MSQKVDRFGAIASSLCAAHCALVALLPLAFSALGLSFLVGHEAEWIFTLFAIGFALITLSLSWRKSRSTLVTTLLALGILGLLASRILEMSSEEHGHHQAAQQVARAHHDEQSERSGHEAIGHGEISHGEISHGEISHGEIGHAVGTLVGVFAGLFLFWGHLLNLRIARRRESCCDHLQIITGTLLTKPMPY